MIAVQVADIAHGNMKWLEWNNVGNNESCRPEKKTRARVRMILQVMRNAFM
jgi:hypothetical protein